MGDLYVGNFGTFLFISIQTTSIKGGVGNGGLNVSETILSHKKPIYLVVLCIFQAKNAKFGKFVIT